MKRLATGLKNIAFAVTNLEKMNCVPSVRSINPATARVWPSHLLRMLGGTMSPSRPSLEGNCGVGPGIARDDSSPASPGIC